VGGAFADVDLDTADGDDRVKDIVGFRPGRQAGLRVEKEVRDLGSKEVEGMKIVHAYGVGGGGYIYSFGVAKRVNALVEELGNQKTIKSRL
jgi:hypothetical protein